MSPSLWQIGIIVLVAVLLFGGRGRISNVLNDLGKGIKSFKKGMSEDEASDSKDTKALNNDKTEDDTKTKEK